MVSGVPQGLVLGVTLYLLFHLHGQWDQCTLSKFTENTQLCSTFHMLDGRNVKKRELESWPHVNLMKFNKDKDKILNLAWGNSKLKYSPEGE